MSDEDQVLLWITTVERSLKHNHEDFLAFLTEQAVPVALRAIAWGDGWRISLHADSASLFAQLVNSALSDLRLQEEIDPDVLSERVARVRVNPDHIRMVNDLDLVQ